MMGVVLREVLDFGERGECVLFEGLDGKDQGLSYVGIGVVFEVDAELWEDGEKVVFESKQRACCLKTGEMARCVVLVIKQSKQRREVMAFSAADERDERGEADNAFVVIKRKLKDWLDLRREFGDVSKGTKDGANLMRFVEAWALKEREKVGEERRGSSADLMEIFEEEGARLFLLEGAAKEREGFFGVAVASEPVGCEKADKRGFVVKLLFPLGDIGGRWLKGA